MNARAVVAEETCYRRLAVWARGRGYHAIPPELILAVAELAETVYRCGELSARDSGVRPRAWDNEITAVTPMEALR